MKNIRLILDTVRENPANVKYADLCRICDHYFGKPRQRGTSHRVYKMPWAGDPRVNIQRKGNKAKPYQVKQVLKALIRLEGMADGR
jgi:hypothetical protein